MTSKRPLIEVASACGQSIALCCWMLITLCALSSSAQTSHRSSARTRAHAGSPSNSGSQEAATEALKTLSSLINQSNFAKFNLRSLDELPKLQLGTPVPLFYVRADKLKDYKTGDSTTGLLVQSNREMYPVLVNGDGRLIITLEKTAQGWRLVSFGEQNIAGNLAKIKHDKVKKATSGPGAISDNYFAVQIPSMELTFLGFTPAPGPGGAGTGERSPVLLTPLNEENNLPTKAAFDNSQFLKFNPSFTPEREGSKNAGEVFSALAPHAAAIVNVKAPQ